MDLFSVVVHRKLQIPTQSCTVASASPGCVTLGSLGEYDFKWSCKGNVLAQETKPGEFPLQSESVQSFAVCLEIAA